MRRQITQAHLDYIRANYLTQTDEEMADALGISKSPVHRARRNLGLVIPTKLTIQRRVAKMIGRTTSTPEIDQILRDNYLTVPVKNLAKLIGKSQTLVKCRLRQLGLVIPREIIEQRIADSRIQKGHVPINKGRKGGDWLSDEARERMAKTQFRKGHVPRNYRPVGYERINVDGYIEVKIAEGPRQFRLKQRVVWEQHHGPIAKGINIQFKDGNRLNCDIINLYAISHAEQMKQNSVHNLPKDIVQTVRLRGVLNRKINQISKR